MNPLRRNGFTVSHFSIKKEVLPVSAPEKKKSFMGEFKTFIARGNVRDMAVGVIIGGAFG